VGAALISRRAWGAIFWVWSSDGVVDVDRCIQRKATIARTMTTAISEIM